MRKSILLRNFYAARLPGILCLAFVFCLVFPVREATAQSTNYWTNSVSGVWAWNDESNWDPGTPTSTVCRVFWTNDATSAYTVHFTGPATSGLIRITSDKIVFDLNGNHWDSPDSGDGADYSGGNPDRSHWFGGGAGEACDVLFSSSSPGENSVNLRSGAQRGWRWGNGTDASTIRITTNLGYGVAVVVPPSGGPNGANVIIRGPGSELRNPGGNYVSFSGANVHVVDGGFLNFGRCYSFWVTGTLTVDNARMFAHDRKTTRIGNLGVGNIVLTNRAAWNSPISLQVGSNRGDGRISIDASTFGVKNVSVGDSSREHGEVRIRNDGLMALTNGTIFVHAGPSASRTNSLYLDHGTIALAGITSRSAITNEGLMRLNGTIRCLDEETMTFGNRGRLEIGQGQGFLSLTNTYFENSSPGTLVFAFQEDGNDAMRIHDGTATIGGTSLFSTVNFTPDRGADREWVFVAADRIEYNAQDNLSDLMDAFGLRSGRDYDFGVRDRDGGQVLRLWIKPPGGTLIRVR